MAKIGFIGTGAIASAMVKGLAGHGHDIWISERNAGVAAELSEAFSEVSIANNQAVIDASDIVILCLMENIARDVLPSLNFKPEQPIISAMLGLTLADLADLCTPANDICITIPLPFVATGGCPLPVYPKSAALEDLFGAHNIIITQNSEAAMNPHFAATALLSALLVQLQAGSDWLARFTGDAAQSEAYVTALFKGAFGDLPNDGAGHIQTLLDDLSTEGGLNQTLRKHMESSGSVDAITSGLDGFRKRLNLPDA